MAQNTQFRTYLTLKLLEFFLRIFPYKMRISFGGKIMRKIVAPRTDLIDRVEKNLKKIFPDLSNGERDKITNGVIDNFGRFYFEFFSSKEFIKRSANFHLSGKGVLPFKQAASEKKPIIVLSGHFGNYEAVRSHLKLLGYEIAGVYRPMNNQYFNTIYIRTMKNYGQPVFPTSLQGTREIVKHLQGGNIVALLNDQYTSDSLPMPFLGKQANTSHIFAKIAMRYKALVVPAFGIRQSNGLDFKVVLDLPIEHTDPIQMAQEFNNRLGELVKQHVDQWFWIHRRWK